MLSKMHIPDLQKIMRSFMNAIELIIRFIFQDTLLYDLVKTIDKGDVLGLMKPRSLHLMYLIYLVVMILIINCMIILSKNFLTTHLTQ